MAIQYNVPGFISPPTVTALICTLNEEESLPHVLRKIPDWVDEILVVDGHSTDKTVEIAQKSRANVRVISQKRKGKGDALKSGFEQAQGDIIVTLDADNATNPTEMINFIEPLLHGYDYVKGTRFIKGESRNKPFHRVIGNWIITMTFNVLFFRLYTDLCSGYNAFWKKRVTSLALFSEDGFENEPLINSRIARAGLKVAEVGHRDDGRNKGEVKESSWRQGFKAIKSIVRERFVG